jgi:hypothetical protein
MKKATITYNAPKGEAKTLEIAGVTLVSGESKQVTCDDAMMARLEAASKGSPMFKVDGVADFTPPPPKALPPDKPEPPPKSEPPKHEEHKGKAA